VLLQKIQQISLHHKCLSNELSNQKTQNFFNLSTTAIWQLKLARAREEVKIQVV